MKNWSKIGSVVRKHYDGKTATFDSLKAAVIGMYKSDIDALQKGRLAYHCKDVFGWSIASGGDNYLFCEESGMVIPLWKVKETFYNISSKEYLDNFYSSHRWYLTGRQSPRFHEGGKNYRNGPVWGVHGNHWGNSGVNVRTTQEIRENVFFDCFDEDAKEHGIKSRGARRRAQLPTAWDDRPAGSYYHTNWKHFRKHQWKEKKGAQAP